MPGNIKSEAPSALHPDQDIIITADQQLIAAAIDN